MDVTIDGIIKNLKELKEQYGSDCKIKSVKIIAEDFMLIDQEEEVASTPF